MPLNMMKNYWPKVELSKRAFHHIRQRTGTLPKSIVPDNSKVLTLFIVFEMWSAGNTCIDYHIIIMLTQGGIAILTTSFT